MFAFTVQIYFITSKYLFYNFSTKLKGKHEKKIIKTNMLSYQLKSDGHPTEKYRCDWKSTKIENNGPEGPS